MIGVALTKIQQEATGGDGVERPGLEAKDVGLTLA
jgi:hypothetical protein